MAKDGRRDYSRTVTSLDELPLSVSSRRALDELGVDTIDVLVGSAADDLLEVASRGAVMEVREVLGELGLALRGETPPVHDVADAPRSPPRRWIWCRHRSTNLATLRRSPRDRAPRSPPGRGVSADGVGNRSARARRRRDLRPRAPGDRECVAGDRGRDVRWPQPWTRVDRTSDSRPTPRCHELRVRHVLPADRSAGDELDRRPSCAVLPRTRALLRNRGARVVTHPTPPAPRALPPFDPVRVIQALASSSFPCLERCMLHLGKATPAALDALAALAARVPELCIDTVIAPIDVGALEVGLRLDECCSRRFSAAPRASDCRGCATAPRGRGHRRAPRSTPRGDFAISREQTPHLHRTCTSTAPRRQLDLNASFGASDAGQPTNAVDFTPATRGASAPTRRMANPSRRALGVA